MDWLDEDIVDLIHSKSKCVTLMRETQSSKKTFGIFEIFKNGIKYRTHVYCQLCDKLLLKNNRSNIIRHCKIHTKFVFTPNDLQLPSCVSDNISDVNINQTEDTIREPKDLSW